MGWLDEGQSGNTTPPAAAPPTPTPGPQPFNAVPPQPTGGQVPFESKLYTPPSVVPNKENWWQYPNSPDTERYIHNTYAYGGISPAAQGQVNQLPFDLKPFEAGSPGVGAVTGSWGTNDMQIPGKIQVDPRMDPTYAMHEMAHVWFSGGSIDPNQFTDALNQFRNSPDSQAKNPEAVQFLQMLDTDPALAYAKDNPNEQFAYFAGWSGGDLNKIPDEIRPFYTGFFTGNPQR